MKNQTRITNIKGIFVVLVVIPLLACAACSNENQSGNISTECKNYVIKHDTLSNERNKWVVFKKRWLLDKKIFQWESPVNGSLTALEILSVSCDRLSNDDVERIKLIGRRCGATDCGIVEYWFRDTGDANVPYVRYTKEEPNPIFDKELDGSPVYQLNYYLWGDFPSISLSLGHAEMIGVPFYACYKNNSFYDCTTKYASNITKRLDRLEQVISRAPKSGVSRETTLKLFVEYLALGMAVQEDVNLQLELWGFDVHTRTKLLSDMSTNLDSTREGGDWKKWSMGSTTYKEMLHDIHDANN